MGIPAECECGASFRVKRELAGKRVKCPACGHKLTVPLPSAELGTSARASKPTLSKPIKVSCKCGKQFRVRPQHAGRKGKCPHCRSVLVIPVPELTADDVIAETTDSWDMANPSIEDLLNEDLPPAVDMPVQAAQGASCPSCNAPMSLDAKVCVSCGYHQQLGRRLTTVVEATKDPLQILPQGITVEEGEDWLQIGTRGTMQSGGPLVIWCAVVLPLLTLFLCGGLFSGSALLARLTGTFLFLGVVGSVAYLVAAAVLNRTTIQIDPKQIFIRCGPLPYSSLGRRRITVDDVAQVYVVEKRRLKPLSVGFGSVTDVVSTAVTVHDVAHTGFVNYSYNVNVVLTNGWRRQLVSLPDRRSAKFIEKKIERFLSVRDVPVLSKWYQRLFLLETTQHDELDLDPSNAISARSLPLPAGVLAATCLFVLLIGFCLFSSLLRLVLR